ncbi:MAG: helix-turn-helix domain-containing protein [Actinomycetota bacterium]|nr:helix-turn-helix domain-containing protein [Actinomycetota bacterium]
MIEIDYELRWLRCREAASLLNVSEATVRRWLYREKLEGLKVGGVVRVDRRSIEKMARTHRYSDVHKTRQLSALSRILCWMGNTT